MPGGLEIEWYTSTSNSCWCCSYTRLTYYKEKHRNFSSC